MNRKIKSDPEERFRILEKALQELADTLKKRDAEYEEEISDLLEDLKALKLFLSRNAPDFKKQFPDIRRKIKKAA